MLKRNHRLSTGLLYLGLLVILLLSANPTTAQSIAQSVKPKSESELVLMMDLDRTPGLEQIFKSQAQRPAPTLTESCQANPNMAKITQDIFTQLHLLRPNAKARSLMFEYPVGNNLAKYWVDDVQQVRYLNQDGISDLVFYVGDDTSQETVVLLVKSDQVKAVFSGVRGLSRFGSRSSLGEIFDDQGKQVSTWSPEKETYIGDGIAWTKQRCVPIRQTPDAKGKVLQTLGERDVVILLERKGDWQKVMDEGQTTGWVDRRQISTQAYTQIFPLK